MGFFQSKHLTVTLSRNAIREKLTRERASNKRGKKLSRQSKGQREKKLRRKK